MKNKHFAIIIWISVLFAPFSGFAKTANAPIKVEDMYVLRSPDRQLELQFVIYDGVPTYSLSRNGNPVVRPSKMGFTLEWRDDLAHAFVLKDTKYSTFDETWEPVWGEEAQIRNHYNEMLVTLEQPIGSVESMDHSTETKATVMQIRFRLYDDGLGFRIRVSRIPGEQRLVCFWFKEEHTEFAMTGDHTAWWIAGDYDTQEYNYTESRLSQIRELWDAGHKDGGWPWTGFSETGVQTALQMKTDDGLYINIHEAATLDFPTMHLEFIDDKNDVCSRLNLTSTPSPMPRATKAASKPLASRLGAR